MPTLTDHNLPDHPLVYRAYNLSNKAHGGQTRKYTGAPYISHPIEVGALVHSVLPDPVAVSGALLHDVLEDTSVSAGMIEDACGPGVLYIVQLLTTLKVEGESRKERMARECVRLAMAPSVAQTIKLADILSNCVDIHILDPAFAKTYVSEKHVLLYHLRKGHPLLWQMAYQRITTILVALKDPA